jgi:hypothetical protein
MTKRIDSPAPQPLHAQGEQEACKTCKGGGEVFSDVGTEGRLIGESCEQCGGSGKSAPPVEQVGEQEVVAWRPYGKNGVIHSWIDGAPGEGDTAAWKAGGFKIEYAYAKGRSPQPQVSAPPAPNASPAGEVVAWRIVASDYAYPWQDGAPSDDAVNALEYGSPRSIQYAYSAPQPLHAQGEQEGDAVILTEEEALALVGYLYCKEGGEGQVTRLRFGRGPNGFGLYVSNRVNEPEECISSLVT